MSSAAKSSSPSCLLRIWQIFVFFFFGSFSFFVWIYRPILGICALAISLLWLVSRFFPAFPFRSGYSWAFLVIIFVASISIRNELGDQVELQENKSGQVVQDLPVQIEHGDKKTKRNDFIFRKSVVWFDFDERQFRSIYSTTRSSYGHSKLSRESQKWSIAADNSIVYMATLYKNLFHIDFKKLDALVQILESQAKSKNLSALETAEMVTTFIQEIDYVLVHDYSCDSASKVGGEFLKTYHKEKKPCLSNIYAGIQSPYEFAHNLKGDCDTRVLMAHVLLTHLGIPSSVWISNKYGHSVLGVGVPVGFGFYKEIKGVKHYAVELTTKGFRIGMIDPRHKVERNWIVSNYVNQ